MLRQNSPLRKLIGPSGVAFLEHAATSFQRILPHVEVSKWTESQSWSNPGAAWTSSQRTQIRITLVIGAKDQPNTRSLTATLQRRCSPNQQPASRRVLDLREHNICKRIALQASKVLAFNSLLANASSLQAISSAFDENIVADHLQSHHRLELPVGKLLNALHTLSEQSYENKALTFGCILDPDPDGDTDSQALFPEDFLKSKKYKALSDGYRTAYLVSTKGRVTGLVDLEDSKDRKLTAQNFYPEWAEPIARASRDRK